MCVQLRCRESYETLANSNDFTTVRDTLNRVEVFS